MGISELREWAAIIISLLAAVLTIGVTMGYMRSRINQNAKNIDALEEKVSDLDKENKTTVQVLGAIQTSIAEIKTDVRWLVEERKNGRKK